ncbi:hypothetical protein EJ06DRAFT_241141 [Trichodelitschia bisporula]|uniref:Uncharacterized protein n=1 Tax=Trichodelitschia bisporula TaxID=703511 RepID=A0A6G1HKN5_9PEZI|nr:hypothetical protein EJ06DRAFT_241141 [Trichodelitschia bisporula]
MTVMTDTLARWLFTSQEGRFLITTNPPTHHCFQYCPIRLFNASERKENPIKPKSRVHRGQHHAHEGAGRIDLEESIRPGNRLRLGGIRVRLLALLVLGKAFDKAALVPQHRRGRRSARGPATPVGAGRTLRSGGPVNRHRGDEVRGGRSARADRARGLRRRVPDQGGGVGGVGGVGGWRGWVGRARPRRWSLRFNSLLLLLED